MNLFREQRARLMMMKREASNEIMLHEEPRLGGKSEQTGEFSGVKKGNKSQRKKIKSAAGGKK